MWLNAKGVRELALKNALTRWKGYFLAGAKKRQAVRAHSFPRFLPDSADALDAVCPQDTAAPNVEDLGSRRSSRRGGEAAEQGYLSWRNKLAKI